MQENCANKNRTSQLITGPYSLNESTSEKVKWLKLRLFMYYLWGAGLT
jgi:hypothetical protein